MSNRAWIFDAACGQLPLQEADAAFYPTGVYGGPNTSSSAYATAARICAECPVRQECLDEALDAEGGTAAGNRYGMRGGLTPYGRYEEYRRRNGLPPVRDRDRGYYSSRRKRLQVEHLAAQLEAAS